jgi:hypothetical protein
VVRWRVVKDNRISSSGLSLDRIFYLTISLDNCVFPFTIVHKVEVFLYGRSDSKPWEDEDEGHQLIFTINTKLELNAVYL